MTDDFKEIKALFNGVYDMFDKHNLIAKEILQVLKDNENEYKELINNLENRVEELENAKS